jgi:hypothetical protein
MVPVHDDGWDDAAEEASERVLRGTLLKFGDGRWSRGKEGLDVPNGISLVALETAAGWVRWSGGKPDAYRMREPGRQLPDREELGDLDKTQWEPGPDGTTPRDPWQNTRFVYLVDPQTAEAFTFSTSSWGGRGAVSDLGDQIGRMRFARPGAVPLVELASAPMVTKFGRKSKPFFKVVGWKHNGSESNVVAQIEPPKPRPATAAKTAELVDDNIPW